MGWQKKARVKLAQALCKAAGECKVRQVSDNALCARLCLAIVCTGGWLDTLLQCFACLWGWFGVAFCRQDIFFIG